MPDATSLTRRVPGVGLAAWIVGVALAAAAGAVASSDSAAVYEGLFKPGWAPPPAVFGPVWTVLYLMMAIAAWLVWRDRGWRRGMRPLGWFIFQLVLNAAWTWLFFAWRQGALAFVDIVALLAALLITIIQFARIRVVAALLLIPYLGWVSFAALLTWTIWHRNLQSLG